MWFVDYYEGLYGYGVRRAFPSLAKAQEFIDVNAMVYRLPDCHITNPHGVRGYVY